MAAAADLRFGIAIPQIFPSGKIEPDAIARWLVKAEALGYYGGWVQEQVLGTVATLDPIPLLSYAAALTDRIKLGTSVMLTVLRNPVPLAKSLASLDQLSQGRLMLGVGLGGYAGVYPAFGMSRGGRIQRFEESIELIKRLWAEDKVSFQGRFWQLDGLSINPRPLQDPRPPIWFGTRSDQALRRAVRMGDGWMGAGATPTADFKEEVKLVRRLLEEEGRDPAAFALSKRVYVAVDENKDRAAQRLREWFGRYYHQPDMALKVSVYGGAEECVQGLAEVADQGVELIMVNPVYDFEEQAERLAKEVLPQLKGR